MGERKKDALRVNFDRKLKLEFHGVKVTSDAGLLTFRELDEAFGFTAMINSKLTDNRACRNTQHSLTALLRQSMMIRIAKQHEFMKVRAVTFCSKVGIGRKAGHK